ncbi:unnamed protein product [Prorocentrum cordatum]|uniref:Uncharacterized protein n=1 Tax=Prorocentrum cordatum TaxID=2364126 RepID=A0ABN9T0T4_9DINO|nr:unnamed protein product [Polarella glacialis]
MHVLDERLTSRFGCQAEDDICHYLRCPRAWHLVSLPRWIPSARLIVRLGLGLPEDQIEDDELQRAAVRRALMYHLYNIIRHEIADNTYDYNMHTSALSAARQRV